MHRLHLTTAIFILAVVPYLHADSVPLIITGASIRIFPNEAGDNTAFGFTGIGLHISGGGSAVCDWCTAGVLLPSGSRLVPNIDLLGFAFSEGKVLIGGHAENVEFLKNSFLTASSLNFPANGQKVFTISVLAFVPDLQGRTDAGQNFELEVPTGKLTLTFRFNPYGNGYEFSKGRFSAGTVAEPGTLSLMGLGLVVTGFLLKRHRTTRTRV